MEKPLDFTRVCRICLNDKDVAISVYEFNISKKLMACATIQVLPNDGLPAQICKICAAKLHTSFQFKRQCERSDAKLRHIASLSKGNGQYELQEQGDPHQDEEIVDNSSNFVFVNCEPLEEVDSEETLTNKYCYSATEPPPLVPLTDVTDATNPIKLEDCTELCYSEESQMGSDENLRTNSLVDDILVTPVVKKMKIEVSPNIISDPLNLPNCDKQFSLIVKSNQMSPSITAKMLDISKCIEHDIKDTQTSISTLDSYKCGICHKSFSESKSYNLHLSSHINKKQFACSVCDEACQSIEQLKRHLHIHTGFAAQEKLRTSKSAKDSTCLNDNIKNSIQEKKFICSFCDQSFINSKELEDHSVTHSAVKPFRCAVCEKSFLKIQYLKIHVKNHCPGHSTESLGFEQSSPTTSSKLNDSNAKVVNSRQGNFDAKYLRNNISASSLNIVPSKLFQCGLCDKQFLIEKNLNSHRKQHNKETDLRCPVCDKPFVTSVDLKDHCVVHAQDKPFGCSRCDKRFSTQNNLNKHEKTHDK